MHSGTMLTWISENHRDILRVLNMLTSHHHGSFSFLTTGAIALTLCGIGLTFNSIKWQLICMTCFFSGVTLVACGCFVHAIRRHRAWQIESLILMILMVIFLAEPLLPAVVQDTLTYLIP
jgi:hypothetical protein